VVQDFAKWWAGTAAVVDFAMWFAEAAAASRTLVSIGRHGRDFAVACRILDGAAANSECSDLEAHRRRSSGAT
jgi:hypothetical protein